MSREADRLPPNSPESERGVLGCIILSPDCIDECRAKLRDGHECFYDVRNQAVFDAMCKLRDKRHGIDLITLQQELGAAGLLDQVGGLSYLAEIETSTPSALNVSTYLEVVWEKHIARRIIRSCVDATAALRDESARPFDALGKIQTAFSNIEIGGGESMDSRSCNIALVDDMQRRCDLFANGKTSGLKTGFRKFDDMTDGLQLGEQTIIAARPSVGKTAIGMNIIDRICIVGGVPSAVFTLEMSPAALMRRLFACHSSIDMKALRTGQFTKDQQISFASFTATLRASPITVVRASRMDAAQIAAHIRQLSRKGVKFVLIDYLQKIKASGRHEKRTYEVGEVSSTLKDVAVDANVALLTLAQLNREPDKDKSKGGRFPRMSDLADSGQIERDADCIALLHRDRADPTGKTALVLDKQRDGETGLINLKFNGQFCRFENELPSDGIPDNQQNRQTND